MMRRFGITRSITSAGTVKESCTVLPVPSSCIELAIASRAAAPARRAVRHARWRLERLYFHLQGELNHALDPHRPALPWRRPGGRGAAGAVVMVVLSIVAYLAAIGVSDPFRSMAISSAG